MTFTHLERPPNPALQPLGGGLRLGVVGINISYLKTLPYGEYFTPPLQHPLDGTWRFSLLLNGISFKNS